MDMHARREHIDYEGYAVLPMAIKQVTISVAAAGAMPWRSAVLCCFVLAPPPGSPPTSRLHPLPTATPLIST